MREKLLNNFFIIINTLCVISFIQEIIKNINKSIQQEPTTMNLLDVFIAVTLTLLIVYFIYHDKKIILNTFDLLTILIQNNKLHTLREIVMVTNKQHTNKTNPCQIKNATFRYTLSPSSEVKSSDSSDIYDVTYEIQLTINYNYLSRCLKHNDNILKFYLILDAYKQSFIHNLPITIRLDSNIEQESLEFNVLPQSVTTSGIDHVDICTGLYEISFQPPKKWIRKTFKCTILYCINQNFKLTTNLNNQEYNFAISPANYGSKLKKIEIEVITPKTLDINIACQRICIGKTAEKIYDFILENDNNIDHNKFVLTSKNFTPQMEAVYFTHLTRIS